MKAKYVWIMLCLLCSSVGFAQDDLFKKYEDVNGVTSVYISKAMFQLMPESAKMDHIDMKDMIDKINSLQVLTTDKKETAGRMESDFRDAVKGYTELMRVKDDGDTVFFYTRQKGEIIEELILLVTEPDEFTTIRITGNFTIEDIQKMTRKIN